MMKLDIRSFLLPLLVCCFIGQAQGQGKIFGFLKKKDKKKAALTEGRSVQDTLQTASSAFLLHNETELCEDEQYLRHVAATSGETVPLPPETPPHEEICQDDEFMEIFNTKGDSLIPLNRKWLDQVDYFSVWDSKNVDPYGFSLKDFNDTIPIQLFGDMDGWSPPLRDTEINSNYGLRRWRWHHGIDLDLTVGDSIFAAFSGVVRIAKYNRGGYGYYVMLRHENGLETLYGHLSKVLVEVGQEVASGELIGLGGNTGRSSGPHLHFETRYKGHAFNPLHLFDFEKEAILLSDFQLSAHHYKGLIDRSRAQYYRIRSGDNLWGISRRYGTSISRLCQMNGITRRTTLRIGRTLRVR